MDEDRTTPAVTALMGVDHLVRGAGEDGPEPPAGQHSPAQDFEFYV